MAWEWSHTPEAYQNVHDNLSELSKNDLIVIYAEIQSSIHDVYFNYTFDDFKYNRYLDNITKQVNNNKIGLDSIVDFIYEFACEYRTCDNGGFNAYICPYGCHMVSFSEKEKD